MKRNAVSTANGQRQGHDQDDRRWSRKQTFHDRDDDRLLDQRAPRVWAARSMSAEPS